MAKKCRKNKKNAELGKGILSAKKIRKKKKKMSRKEVIAHNKEAAVTIVNATRTMTENLNKTTKEYLDLVELVGKGKRELTPEVMVVLSMLCKEVIEGNRALVDAMAQLVAHTSAAADAIYGSREKSK